MRAALLGCVALVLAACTSLPHSELSPRTITLTLATPETIEAVCKDAPHPKGSHVLACTARSGLWCSVYLPVPQSPNDTHWLEMAYHELLHCEKGAWHE